MMKARRISRRCLHHEGTTLILVFCYNNYLTKSTKNQIKESTTVLVLMHWTLGWAYNNPSILILSPSTRGPWQYSRSQDHRQILCQFVWLYLYIKKLKSWLLLGTQRGVVKYLTEIIIQKIKRVHCVIMYHFCHHLTLLVVYNNFESERWRPAGNTTLSLVTLP